MLGMYINALPKIEEDLHQNGGRAVYSAVAAVDCIRALLHDIRSSGDQHALIEKLRRDAFQPTLSALATDLIAQLGDLRAELNGKLTSEAASKTDAGMRKLQLGFTRAFTDADERAHELVQRALAT